MGLLKKFIKRGYRMYPEPPKVYDVSLEDRLEAILSKKISDADRTIIFSFQKYYKKNNFLSEKQYNFFVVLETRYSEERIKESQEWVSNFTDEMKEKFRLAVKYYKSTNYFGDVVRIAANNPAYIPTEKQYNKMCENKYFMRALEYYNTPPKYELADLVVFRKSAGYGRNQDLVCLVESISDDPSFHSHGRSYKLLVIGKEDSMTVLEDEIKLYRRKRNV